MVLRSFFINLSQNKVLNHLAKQYGYKLGAKTVVAGTNLDEMIESIHKLNAAGISATIDNLGEFVSREEDAIQARTDILDVIDAIHTHKLDAHISFKPSQLGLDIDYGFSLDNIRTIVEHAKQYDIFVNMDMEEYSHLDPSFALIDELSKSYDNIGTVIQSYFFRAEEDIEKYKHMRLRLVKGAYQEDPYVAYQKKATIDKQLIELAEYHLLQDGFTSIATHDHEIINHLKKFININGISRDTFEFQMLYGFRNELQHQLVDEGYNFCTYVPFGKDWYGYFMRRLAERPQNINLIFKQVFTPKVNTTIGVGLGSLLLWRLSKRRK